MSKLLPSANNDINPHTGPLTGSTPTTKKL